MKEIQWQADTKKEMANLPHSVRKDIGLALYAEQINKPHPAIKPLKGFKHVVREIKSSAQSSTYRAVYVVNLGEKIYVLHVFQKKSSTGIKTPKPHMDLIRKRLKELEQKLKEDQQ